MVDSAETFVVHFIRVVIDDAVSGDFLKKAVKRHEEKPTPLPLVLIREDRVACSRTSPSRRRR
jgi:hypothetical protein